MIMSPEEDKSTGFCETTKKTYKTVEYYIVKLSNLIEYYIIQMNVYVVNMQYTSRQ